MKKIIVLLIALSIMSCEKKDIGTQESPKTVVSYSNSEEKNEEIGLLKIVALTGDTKISLEEAENVALFTAIHMREIEGITTKTPLKIESVDIISGRNKNANLHAKGYSNEADLYLFNFENNQGYVLTSADKRFPVFLHIAPKVH